MTKLAPAATCTSQLLVRASSGFQQTLCLGGSERVILHTEFIRAYPGSGSKSLGNNGQQERSLRALENQPMISNATQSPGVR